MAPQVSNMKVQQFVMAYEAEQDRLRALLPDGFTSLRPVLRINGEIRAGQKGYLELNTPVEKDGNRGWINIAFWEDIPFTKDGKTTVFENDYIRISFTGIGLEGGCPAEKDNAGCYYYKNGWYLKAAEVISSNKEFCDCRFAWKLPGGAAGESQGKTLPAYPSEPKIVYPKAQLTVENAARITCAQVLGTYVVEFRRETNFAE